MTQAAPGGRTRILAAAMRLFGAQGFTGTSVRAVATAAGVSPALVLHHFGSKDGLRAAVDSEVLGRLAQAAETVLQSMPPEGPASVDGFVQRVTANVGQVVAVPELRAHVRRSLLDGGHASEQLALQAFAIAKREVALLREADVLRPDADEQEVALQLVLLVLGPVLIAPALESALDVSPYSTEGIERRTRAAVELLTRGVFRHVDD